MISYFFESPHVRVFLFFTTVLSLLFSNTALAFHIMIDPGHGGSDRGAVYNNIKEADLVLQWAQKLKKSLELNPDYKVSLTRSSSITLSLEDRVEKAEKEKVDLFISLHANAAFDRRARGVELYFQNNLPPEEEEMFLAHLENNSRGAEAKKQISKNIFALSKKSDINTIIEDLKHQSRLRKSLQATQLIATSWAESEDGAKSKITIKQAPFFVVSQTSMPSMLIEIGFLSHPTDYKKLMDHQYQNQIIGKIHQALNIYKEKVDKKQQHSLD